MEVCGAVAGSQETDLPYFEQKLDLLAAQISPEEHLARLHRTVDLVGLPDLTSAARTGTFDIAKFLKARRSEECKQFRSWLRNLDDLDDDELRDQVASVRSRLGVSLHTPTGKTLRLALSTGVGLIPIVGPILGFAAGPLDSFVAEKLLPESGPVAFLTRHYPSMFESPKG